jgi:hypothetical protein
MLARPWLALSLLALLPACSEARPQGQTGPARQGPAQKGGSPVLQLAFEDTCQPDAAVELGRQVSPTGISFADGIEGRAVHLDDAAVRLAGLERLELPDSLTLEFFVNLADWHNPYGEGTVQNLVSQGDVLAVAVKGWELEARLTTAGASKALRFSGDSFAPDSWHHVALVVDGEQGQARLVLDGHDVARTSVRGKLAVDPALELVVGSWREQEETFTGFLDSVRLWPRALTVSELRARAALITKGSAPAIRG